MHQPDQPLPTHPRVSRRAAVQAGTLGMLGLGMHHVQGLKAAPAGKADNTTFRRCVYIFLSGGLSQHDSFDLKPDAPLAIRG